MAASENPAMGDFPARKFASMAVTGFCSISTVACKNLSSSSLAIARSDSLRSWRLHQPSEVLPTFSKLLKVRRTSNQLTALSLRIRPRRRCFHLRRLAPERQTDSDESGQRCILNNRRAGRRPLRMERNTHMWRAPLKQCQR